MPFITCCGRILTADGHPAVALWFLERQSARRTAFLARYC